MGAWPPGPVHAGGHGALAAAVRRLVAAGAPARDIAAHLGGDELAVLLLGAVGLAVCTAADRLGELVATPARSRATACAPRSP